MNQNEAEQLIALAKKEISEKGKQIARIIFPELESEKQVISSEDSSENSSAD